MADMKPTVEQLLKANFGGESSARIGWNTAKKKVAKQIDTKKHFKSNFGPKLDDLRDICEGAMEVKKFHSKLDERTTGPCKKRAAAVKKGISDYRAIVSKESKAAGLTPAQKAAWDSLGTALTNVEAETRRWCLKVGFKPF